MNDDKHTDMNDNINDEDTNNEKAKPKPPSSEEKDNEDVDDDDDDNWSRQVETDSMTHPEPNLSTTDIPLPARNRSLKEQLVLRERERRIETERARLKHQFALQNNNRQNAPIDEEAADGSVAEESTKVHADEETGEKEELGFNMERFLRNSDSFDPQPQTVHRSQTDNTTLMERFLSAPVLLGAHVTMSDEDANPSGHTRDANRAGSLDEASIMRDPSFTEDHTFIDTSASVVVEADADDLAQDALLNSSVTGDGMSDDITATPGTTDEQPRVLRLTEADMQELAAIEEASIGNAPPSEREDDIFSDDEVGELAGFTTGGLLQEQLVTFSQGTPTTVIESTASNASIRASSDVDPTTSGSIPSRDEDDAPLNSPLVTTVASDSFAETPEEPIINRKIRPGMIPFRPTQAGAAIRAAREAPMEVPVQVEGFDFDKETCSPSRPNHNDSYEGLPDDWPATPPRPETTSTLRLDNAGDGYGSISHAPDRFHVRRQDINGETEPLLGDVPPEIITHRENSEGREGPSLLRRKSSTGAVLSAVESIFSNVHSQDEEEKELRNQECDIYNTSSILARAFPERMFALFVTLLFELPVLLVISGGSESLCLLIGRWRYQLLMGFIPLTSAISGNVGLQASTLTTRAISHHHVTAREYMPWFIKEVSAAACLGLAMGILLGSVALVASGIDWAFALTIFVAQVVSMVTAGITGTFAPLLFTFFFKRDAGKWSGPLETAIQDIVGSFAMVVISYKILEWLGDGPRDENDVCGPSST